VDDNKKLLGIVHLDKIRSVIFDSHNHRKTLVRDLMTTPSVVIQAQENLHQILTKFEETKSWNLPVIDRGQYVGFLSKSSILTRYRNELMESG
jgi:CIC family chloride channel protein